MPRKGHHGKSLGGYAVSSIFVILLLGFTPISHFLLRQVDGSFSPSSYSSLSLAVPSQGELGVVAGKSVAVILANHTGQIRTYQWAATQDGVLIHRGVQTVRDGQAEQIAIPTRGARVGRLQISLSGTGVYVTVNILKSVSSRIQKSTTQRP